MTSAQTNRDRLREQQSTATGPASAVAWGLAAAKSNSELALVTPPTPGAKTAEGCCEQSRAFRFLSSNRFTIKRACQPSDVNRCSSVM